MYNLNVVTHYNKECGGDYTKITVEMDGTVLAEFGDQYHDKGKDKVYGYIQAFYDLFGTQEVRVTYSDREDVD
jgi:hypothetical protein